MTDFRPPASFYKRGRKHDFIKGGEFLMRLMTVTFWGTPPLGVTDASFLQVSLKLRRCVSELALPFGFRQRRGRRVANDSKAEAVPVHV